MTIQDGSSSIVQIQDFKMELSFFLKSRKWEQKPFRFDEIMQDS